MSYFLPFHTVHGILKARILKWLVIPFSSGPHFVRTLHHDPPVLGGPAQHGSYFIELDKAETVEQLYQINSHTVKKVLGCTTDFPTWGSGKGTENPQGIWLWRPVGFDYRTYKGQGKQTLGGHKQNLVHTRTQEKGAVTPEETDPDLPVSVQNSLAEAWVDSGLWQGQGHWIQLDLLKEVLYFHYPTIAWFRSNNREGIQPHPSTENWVKDLLNMTLPIRPRPKFPSQSVSHNRKLQ